MGGSSRSVLGHLDSLCSAHARRHPSLLGCHALQELLQKDFDMLNFFRSDTACRVQVQGPLEMQTYEPR